MEIRDADEKLRRVQVFVRSIEILLEIRTITKMDLPKEEYRSIEGEKIGVNTRLKIVKIHPRRRTSTTQREEEREGK